MKGPKVVAESAKRLEKVPNVSKREHQDFEKEQKGSGSCC
jgi:hypothetical protein